MQEYAWIPWTLSLLTLIALLVQAALIHRTYRADHERRKKQATIEYLNTIRPKYRELNDRLISRFGSDTWINTSEITEDDRSSIKELLSLIEHFALGVNVGIYDIGIVRRASGHYFLRIHKRLTPYMEESRKTLPTFWIEFDEMCKSLDRLVNPETKKKSGFRSLGEIKNS